MADPNHFDVLVLGTGVAESLLAAAYARKGHTILHLDARPHYGAASAALSFHDLTSLSTLGCYTDLRHATDPDHATWLANKSREFALELNPKLLYARGSVVDLFATTGVGRHLDFKLTEATRVHRGTAPGGDQALLVPASKEDVFASKDLSLADKRRLMRFFTTSMAMDAPPATEGSFADYLTQNGLTGALQDVFVHGVALSRTPGSSLPVAEGMARAHKYLQSMGRFGASPFLLAQYGVGAEVAQALCRVAAVYAGVYILGRPITSVLWDADAQVWRVKVDLDPAQEFTAKRLVTNPGHITAASSASVGAPTYGALVVTQRPVREDTGLGIYVVPPPADGEGEAVQVVHACSELKVCPDGTFVVHFRGSSEADVDRAMALLLPCPEDILHTTRFVHRPNAAGSDEPVVSAADGAPMTVVSWPTADLDMDVDLDAVLDMWRAETGLDTLLEPLPNPDEEQIVAEAQQVQAEGLEEPATSA
ncbi:hypothetical protein AMAG_07656 [Allomyces macrogynus ATCC 38327]|uniref:Rab proteins geranylgeranyltransferase n=1 Tax=Allomyces macrogynus (strain ATCC 38327) TaxID=578462 RepID=A0A0L0SIX4_ALLM3|nr:hypothetical protein AMAG_07656 [Allomyces macrogynus ATCC 38327]|eukprot:KNE62437.1 hypothetical protein AMAG_07656 [Allomyces macrogynus ATCC 38327]